MSTARKIPFNQYTKQIYKIFKRYVQYTLHRSNDFIKTLFLGVSILAEFFIFIRFDKFIVGENIQKCCKSLFRKRYNI